MNEILRTAGCPDLPAARSALKAQLESLCGFFQQNQIPPAALCGDILELLPAVLEAQKAVVQPGPEIRIIFKDVSGNSMTAAGYLKELQGHSEAVQILSQAGLRKLVPDGDALLAGPEAQYLLEHGYLMPVQILLKTSQQNWYMLTEKAWKLFRGKKAMRELKEKMTSVQFSMPAALADSPSERGEQTVAGYWLLQQYFLHDGSEAQSVLFTFPGHVRIPAACRADVSAEICYTIPWMPEVYQEDDLDFLRTLISTVEIDRIRFVTMREEARSEIPLLPDPESQLPVKEKLEYFIPEQFLEVPYESE